MNFFTKMILGTVCAVAALPLYAQNSLVNARFSAGQVKCTVLLDSRRMRDSSILVSPDNPGLLAKIPSGYSVESDNTVFMASFGNEIALFDTGNGAASRGLLMQALREEKIAPEKVTAIFITHMHGDHIGGLLFEGKPAFPNAVVYVPAQEAAYWLPQDISAVPSGQRSRLENGIRIFDALREAGQKVVFFESGADMSPYFGKGRFSFVSMPAFGHTPGHTVYRITSDASGLLVWGDILHVIDPQLAFPDISASFDMNTSQAAIERKKILDLAVKDNLLVTGTHTVFPAVFRIQRDGRNGFQKTPFSSATSR